MGRKQKHKRDRVGQTQTSRASNTVESRRRLRVFAVVVALLAFLPYINALRGDFVLDDVDIVAQNPLIRDLGNVGRIFSTDYWSGAVGTMAVGDPGLYRPLTVSSFAIDYRLWDLSPAAYHAVSVALHMAASVALFVVAADVIAIPIAAFAAAAVFAVHPVHTEAVTGIVGRAEVLATLFFLLAFLLLRARPTPASVGRSVGGAVLYLCAILSKEIGATLPIVLLLDDWLRRDEWATDRPRLARELVIRYAPLIVAAALYLTLRSRAVHAPAQMWVGFAGVSAGARMLTALRVLAEYAGLFVFPRTLLADYWKTDVPIARSIAEPMVLGAIVLWASVVAVAVRFRRDRLFVFALGWFVITILPVSNLLFAIGVGKAERILYLPSAGLCLLVGWAAHRIMQHTRATWIVPVSLAPILLACAGRTYLRNEDWQNAQQLASASLRVSPSSPLMNDMAAWELVKQNRPADAIPLLREAVRQVPDQALYHNHLGTAYYKTAQLDSAAAQLTEAITLRPGDADAHNNLGVVYLDLRRPDDAIREFTAAIRANPAHADAHNNLGFLYLERQQLDLARSEFAASVSTRPESPEAHNNLGVVYLRGGQLDSAAAQFREAIRLRPDYASARANLDATIAKQQPAANR